MSSTGMANGKYECRMFSNDPSETMDADPRESVKTM
jgi:hypothetical protein